jgi:hypothetical protein|tara:strand:- start:322857 stop:323714 length:858 start_codon:yes stop_codon:yes gene_type:complete
MWLIPAVLCLLFLCFMTVWNQRVRMPALQLNLWRCLYISLLFALTLPFVDFPTDIHFYISAFVAGLASMTVSTSLFYTAREHSAHIASLYMPLAMIFTFVTWLFFDPALLDAYISMPFKAALIFIAMVVANIAVIKMRHIRFTHTSFLGLVLLNAGMIAVSQILVKGSAQNSLDMVLVLSFIVFVVQAIATWLWMLVRREDVGAALFNKNIAVLCIVSALSCICSWYAVILAPNPSYSIAVLLGAPFILTLYHRYYKHDISQSLKAGAVITLCSLLIVILSFGVA